MGRNQLRAPYEVTTMDQTYGAPAFLHADPVSAVAFSPDGALLATGDRDRGVRVWTSGGALLHALAHDRVGSRSSGQAVVTHVAFSADGKRLASVVSRMGGHEQDDVRVWDLDGPREVFTCTAPYRDGVAFSPCGRYIASPGGGAHPFLLLDAQTGRARPLPDLLYCAEAVAFSPDGELLAAASGGEVKLVATRTGVLVAQASVPAPGDGSRAIAVAFADGGSELVAGCPGRGIYRWAVPALRPRTPVRWIDETIRESVLAGAERFFAVGYEELTVVDRVTAKRVAEYPIANRTVALSPDGASLAVASGFAVRIVDAMDGAERSPFRHTSFVAHVKLADGERALWTADNDGETCKWERATGRMLAHMSGFRVLALSPDGSTGLGFDSARYRWDDDDKPLELRDLAKAKVLRSFKAAHPVAYSADGALFAAKKTTKKGETIAVFRPTGAELWEVDVGTVYALAFVRADEGERLVLGTKQQRLIAVDAATGETLWSVYERKAGGTLVASPDGRLIAAIGDGGVALRRTKDGSAVRTFAASRHLVRDAEFTRDGRHLLLVDDTLTAWSVAKGERVAMRSVRGMELDLTADGASVAVAQTAGAAILDVAELLSPTRPKRAAAADKPKRPKAARRSPAPRATEVTSYDAGTRTAYIADVRSGRTITRPEKLATLARLKKNKALSTGEPVERVVLIVPTPADATALAHLVTDGKVDGVVSVGKA